MKEVYVLEVYEAFPDEVKITNTHLYSSLEKALAECAEDEVYSQLSLREIGDEHYMGNGIVKGRLFKDYGATYMSITVTSKTVL